MSKSIVLVGILAVFICIGCNDKKNSATTDNDKDISGTWIYKWGYPGYEPSIIIKLELNDYGSYSFSTKDGAENSFEMGNYVIDGSTLILNSNGGGSHNCSITSSSIRIGKYYLNKE